MERVKLPTLPVVALALQRGRENVKVFRSIIAVLLFTIGLLPAYAQSSATIRGVVVDQNGSLPISGARVDLDVGKTSVATTVTDDTGSFTFAGEAPRTYTIVITGPGLSATRSDPIDARVGRARTMRLAISRSPTALNVIGRTQSVSSLASAGLQTSSTITRTVDPTVLQNENYLRLGDGLATLPGVNVSAAKSANIGSDLYIDIRGFGRGETQTLLDGHPIGPFGVGVAAFGAGGYNYQDRLCSRYRVQRSVTARRPRSMG